MGRYSDLLTGKTGKPHGAAAADINSLNSFFRMVALPVHTQEDAPSPERIYTKETNYSGYCNESREGGIRNNEINELTPEGMGADWRHLFEERAAHREYDGGYTHAEAERLAWGEMQNRWHMEHGDRVPRDLCAGCRQQLGSTEVLDLIDGTRCISRTMNV